MMFWLQSPSSLRDALGAVVDTAHARDRGAATVRGSAAEWRIIDRAGNTLGILAGQVSPDGEIEAINDIAIEGAQCRPRLRGPHGRQPHGDVRIIEAIDQSQPFWDKMGAGYYDHRKNSSLDWSGLSRGLAGDEVQGAGREAEHAEPGAPEVSEPSAEEAERLGFKFSRGRDESATEGWQAPGASKFDDLVYKLQAGRHQARRRCHQGCRRRHTRRPRLERRRRVE